MTVIPSCPALVVHDDDSFRRSLIAELDQEHFTVTYSPDGPEAVKALRERSFKVIVLGIDLNKRRGLEALDYLREHRAAVRGGVILLGDPNPELRNYARLADETLLKPVDAHYVAQRARVYCGD
ncbi:MAG TPA: response regulator [Thermoanaerobaculia bacterium]|jgi:DNA-binding response OmpR family regulator